jgi:hypothetical protein
VTGCRVCDAAQELIHAINGLRDTGYARRNTQVEADRRHDAEAAWLARRDEPHTCWRSPNAEAGR